MKIIIPMSGVGSRFVQAGYKDLKPLIEVNGKTMIEWVVSMFPEEADFTFICREDHLKETPLLSVLNKIKKNANIVSIKPHKKGPVHALFQAFDTIDDQSPCLISYCDYYMQWDYADFKKVVLANHCDGSVPCYTGFHPHLIPKKNLYAGCRIDSNNRLLEIKEKHSFEVDKFKGHHSPGTYFFKTGSLLKYYCQKMIEEDFNLNGEFYVSMVYEFMLKDHKDIYVYDKIPHFCQWGTPEDLKEFEFWTSTIRGNL